MLQVTILSSHVIAFYLNILSDFNAFFELNTHSVRLNDIFINFRIFMFALSKYVHIIITRKRSCDVI